MAILKTYSHSLTGSIPDMSRCRTELWRGHLVCSHTVPKLNAWAKSTGLWFVRPIQGSYSTSVKESAGTHAGGGAVDVEGDGTSIPDLWKYSRMARDFGLLAWARPWARNYHIHLLDPACPNLHPSAVVQIDVSARKGLNGLAAPIFDELRGYKYPELLAMFASRFMSASTVARGAAQKMLLRKDGRPINKEFPWGAFPAEYRGKPISRGARGYAVKQVQAAVGLRDGRGRDGIYGAQTENRVRDYQKSRGLTVDGKVGPQTWAKMVNEATGW